MNIMCPLPLAIRTFLNLRFEEAFFWEGETNSKCLQFSGDNLSVNITVSKNYLNALIIIIIIALLIMTEAVKRRTLVLIAGYVFIIIGLLVTGLSEAKKRQRNEVVKKAYKAKFQQRSAYCLQFNSGKNVDDTSVLRFHRETRRCYRIGERGPCGEMMVFTIEDANFGVCDCDQSRRCGRPLIFWPPKNRCYYVYDQGPCKQGKWLVFGFDLHPVCRRNSCLDKETRQPNNGNKYWFTYKGQCYRTYTQGYCHDKNEILFNIRTHFRPTCVKNTDCGKVPGRGSIQSLTCLPGQRLDFFGKCDREYKPLKPLVNTTGLGIPVTRRPSNLHCLFCKLF